MCVLGAADRSRAHTPLTPDKVAFVTFAAPRMPPYEPLKTVGQPYDMTGASCTLDRTQRPCRPALPDTPVTALQSLRTAVVDRAWACTCPEELLLSQMAPAGSDLQWQRCPGR
jgi:hypothetical protein